MSTRSFPAGRSRPPSADHARDAKRRGATRCRRPFCIALHWRIDTANEANMTGLPLEASYEDIIATAVSLFHLRGWSSAAGELRLSEEDLKRIADGELDELPDPTILPRLQTWIASRMSDSFTLRNRPLPPF